MKRLLLLLLLIPLLAACGSNVNEGPTNPVGDNIVDEKDGSDEDKAKDEDGNKDDDATKDDDGSKIDDSTYGVELSGSVGAVVLCNTDGSNVTRDVRFVFKGPFAEDIAFAIATEHTFDGAAWTSGDIEEHAAQAVAEGVRTIEVEMTFSTTGDGVSVGMETLPLPLYTDASKAATLPEADLSIDVEFVDYCQPAFEEFEIEFDKLTAGGGASPTVFWAEGLSRNLADGLYLDFVPRDGKGEVISNPWPGSSGWQVDENGYKMVVKLDGKMAGKAWDIVLYYDGGDDAREDPFVIARGYVEL